MRASNQLQTHSGSGTILGAIVGIVVFGSIWGAMEATLGGLLHLIHLPYKGAIMGGIGMSMMAAFLVIYRQPKLILWIGVIAALFKPLSALIYGQPVFAPFVVNPASAIILEALAFTLVASLLFKGFESRVKVRIAAGISVGYLSLALYAALASIAGMGNWAFWGFTERVTSALAGGTSLAIAGTCLLLLGHLVGMELRPRFWRLSSTRPGLFYAGTAATIASCWVIAAVAFALGL